MPEQSLIPQEIQAQLGEIGACDIVVGVPSLNNAATIADVVEALLQGLHDSFPSARGLIVNTDGGSKDDTPEAVLGVAAPSNSVLQIPYRLQPVHKLAAPGAGVPGKASALRLTFQVAQMAGARACAIVDAGLRSVTPEWIGALASPVLHQNSDFVVPCFARHRFEGTITSAIIYPLTRSLYGKRLRHRPGEEFCCSARFVEHCLAQDIWESDLARAGIDSWLTAQALSSGFRTAQTWLGPRILDAREPASDLSGILTQVLGSTFTEMDRNARAWQRVRGSEPVPTFGQPLQLDDEPATLDLDEMIASYRLGYRNLFELWGLVLPPAALVELKRLAARAGRDFRFPDDVWVHIIYDFAVAWHQRTINRDHLLRALTPLYLGWVASFILELQPAEPSRVESRIEEICLRFEAEKPYLISRWRWPDRFNP